MKIYSRNITFLIMVFIIITNISLASEIKKKNGQIIKGEIDGVIVLEDHSGFGDPSYFKVDGKDIETIDERGVRCKKESDVVMITTDELGGYLLDQLESSRVKNHKLLTSGAKLLGEFRMENDEPKLIPAIEIITENGNVAISVDEIVKFTAYVDETIKTWHWLTYSILLLLLYLITLYIRSIAFGDLPFYSIPILSATSRTIGGFGSYGTETRIMYDLSKVGRHSIQLSLKEFLLHPRQLFAILWLVPGMIITVLISNIFEAGSIPYWICLAAGGIFNIVAASSIVKDSITSGEMKKKVIKERGGEKDKWNCLPLDQWESFRRTLS